MNDKNTNSQDVVLSRSIIDVVDPEMLQGASGNLFMDEIQLYGSLYQQKFLEKRDRDEILNLGRYAVKRFMLAFFVGALANRMITKLKYGRYDFLNLRLFFRFSVRLAIFAGSMYYLCGLPTYDKIFKLREYFNRKYVPKFIRFQSTGDALEMNPDLLNEPGMTDEEKDYMRGFYERQKMQGDMAKKKEK